MRNNICKAVLLSFLLIAIPIMAQKEVAKGSDKLLSQSIFKAKEYNDCLLKIKKPGRYSIQVQSKQGTRIEIVDKMAGPFASNGIVGKKDGRLDLILDSGVYKIRIYSHKKGIGKVNIKVFPFQEVQQFSNIVDLPFIHNLELYQYRLKDLEQKSLWINIRKRQVLRLEILGRNIKDARLWKDGTWLVDVSPTITQYEPIAGHPMTYVEFHHDLNPGLYLFTCYGGQSLKWANENNKNPLYIRMGIPDIGRNGQHLTSISPFGRDAFIVDKKTNFFQIIRKDKKPTTLFLKSLKKASGRFSQYGKRAYINKKSRDPWCIIKGSTWSKKQFIIVKGKPGDNIELDYFEQRRYYGLPRKYNKFWVSTIQSAEGKDSIDITGIISKPKLKTPVKALVVNVGPEHPIVRKVNILNTFSVYIYIEKRGTYRIDEDSNAGGSGTYQIKPFMVSKPRGYKDPPFQEAKTDFELLKGYYVLFVRPKSKGILHFALYKKEGFLTTLSRSIFSKQGINEHFKGESLLTRQTLIWPCVKLPFIPYRYQYYTLWLNKRPYVETGVIVRKLPMNLDTSLPVMLNPGQSVPIKIECDKRSYLDVYGGSYKLTINGERFSKQAIINKGIHNLEIKNISTKICLYTLKTRSVDMYIPPKPVIKKVDEVYQVIASNKPIFKNFDSMEKKSFLLRVKEPGLYRMETLGRLAFRMTVRTRTTTSLFKTKMNGIGRNALVQQYFKPGDYLVSVQAQGKSRGRAGIQLKRTELEKPEELFMGRTSSSFVKADTAIHYNFTIKNAGIHHVETYSLGKRITHRIEDYDGWPLYRPGSYHVIERYFDKGTYTYYSLPIEIDSQRVTFIYKKRKKRIISGKGPHILELNKSIDNIWIEEPDRAKDIYQVKIPAFAEFSLNVTNNMKASIYLKHGKNVEETKSGKWSGKLSPGIYEISVISPEKNNKVPYTIYLQTKYLVPGLTQKVYHLPATLNVSVSKDVFVDISSFGQTDVKAYLLDKDSNALITKNDDKPNDWNFRISCRLKAGIYKLKLVSIGSSSDQFEVKMNQRDYKELEPVNIPFTLNEKLGKEVLQIPFSTCENESLVNFNTKNKKNIKLAIMKGDVLIAEGKGHIYIPLPSKKNYILYVWDEENIVKERNKVLIEGKPMKLKDITFDKNQIKLATPNAIRFQNNNRLSYCFNTSSKRTYYSPELERPCLILDGFTKGTKNINGWLVSEDRKPITIQPFDVKPEQPIKVMLEKVPISFLIKQKQKAPMLLKIKSIKSIVGAMVSPENNLPENHVQWSGMLAKEAQTLVGIPGYGKYRGYIWKTHKTPLLTSENIKEIARDRISIYINSYPIQDTKDLRNVSNLEANISAGRSFLLLMEDKKQVLNMVLTKGLVAFSWYLNKPFDIVSSLNQNRECQIKVNGKNLFVLNTSNHSGLFRVEKMEKPYTESDKFDLKNGFEKLFKKPGKLRFKIEEIPKNMHLFITGDIVNSCFWGSNGLIYNSIYSRNPFDTFRYNVKQGYIEVDHNKGFVKIWQASLNDYAKAFIGKFEEAHIEEFQSNRGDMAGISQVWPFSLEKPGFISVKTSAPVVLALLSEDKLLQMSVCYENKRCELNQYLQSGNYKLFTRPINGLSGKGILKLNKITPIDINNGINNDLHLIRPGEIQVYRFSVNKESSVGVGLKTESDNLEAYLYDEKSTLISKGALMFNKLKPGKYILVVKAHGTPVQYYPIILGVQGTRKGVPEDVIRKYKKEESQ